MFKKGVDTLEIIHGPFTISVENPKESEDKRVTDITFNGKSIGVGVGQVLRTARSEEFGRVRFSMEHIAEVLGKSMNFLYQIERNERKASPKLLRLLANMYGLEGYYPLFALLDEILTVDEYLVLINKDNNQNFNQQHSIDVYHLLNNPHSAVLYDGELLTDKSKHMMLGALEIINKRCEK